MTLRGLPVVRPVVVSFNTGMSETCHPLRPPLNVIKPRWTVFIVLKNRSLGMLGSCPSRVQLNADASSTFRYQADAFWFGSPLPEVIRLRRLLLM
jgi:hypothetical protein